MNFNIISKIQNLFCLEIGDIDKEINKDKINKARWTILDPSQIIAITTKTENAKKILRFFNLKLSNQPHIKYTGKGVTYFNLKYLKGLLEIAFLDGIEFSGDNYLKLNVQNDAPIEIETKNFFLYLSPYIRADDER
jgi:hypothetical protein